ncbi:recombinase family protein [Bacillus andreraoultii]|uniref:recombinase family protein n=1 Tax=Bacillus andreraoultii TaxID=1499685 RepID=UPI00053A6319|nr:recombinase family protein [Bacillus andreraoultii]
MNALENVPYNVYESIKFVAIYLRKSRNEEGISDEDVLLKHRSQLLDFCNRHGFDYDIFQEIGSSDTIEFRPEFKRLLERVQRKIYDAVLVIDFDRITRGDTYEYGYIKRIFAESNTPILTPYGDFIDLSDETNILIDVKASMGRYEYIQTKKRFKEGKKRSARLGRWSNGTPPIGYNYDRNTKSLVIDEEAAEMVRKIFEWYVNDDLPLQQIAFRLNRMGYRTRRGKFFQEIQIQRILTNETYIGTIIYGKTEGSGHKKKKTKPLRKKPEDEWIRVEGCHEPIIDKDIFYRAGTKLAKRQKIPRKARQEVYTLSGLIRCKRCGSLMRQYLRKRADGSKVLNVRICQHTDPFGNRCGNSGCNSEILLIALKEQIEEYRNKLLDSSGVVDMDSQKRLKEKIAIIREELAKLEEGLERIKTLFVDGYIDKEEMDKRTEEQSKKVETKRRELRSYEAEYNSVSNDTVEKKLKLVESIAEQLDVTNPFDKRLNRDLRKLVDYVSYERNGEKFNIKVEFY